MTNELPAQKFFPIPGFPAYVSSLDALDVVRVKPARRGPTAGRAQHRMKAVIHPRGVDWVMQLTDEEGKRKRIGISKLAKLMLDTYGPICESSALE
jgi:hypothetical protein